ncbi:DUF6221 family protein [Actinacidiphila sp. DG2A-62]|uniref:DUF6221 family protein n=1 Tax=Actinacidiphila sp. DG2A-62 TaxID=3108821 RepID=UPI002DB6D184|nr:DUF6221 family protein [Actinacidiphila sp. DG2A-62]MEC3994026.1 DUF6221 family protein [Actinacidiphila sp. DG2A-62]
MFNTHTAISKFLTARYAEDVDKAQRAAELLLNVGAPQMGMSKPVAERHGRVDIQRAELQQRFLDETVLPHLGADGPLGENADRQLRLLAWAYSNHPDYKDRWLP